MKTANGLKGQWQMRLRRRGASLAGLLGVLGTVDMVWAHNASQPFGLPAPLWLYTFSVIATITASALTISTFIRGEPALRGLIVTWPRIHLHDAVILRWLVPPMAIGSAVVGVFIALLIAGSIRDQSPAAERFNVAAAEKGRPTRMTMPPGITFERCLTLTPDQTLSYRFQADRPLVFDIHYHAQKVQHYAIREHTVSSGSRRFTPASAQEYCLTWQNPTDDRVTFSWSLTTATAHNQAPFIP